MWNKLTELKELKAFHQRKVASALDIDAAIYCKVGWCSMSLKGEYLSVLFESCSVSEEMFFKQWLADTVKPKCRVAKEVLLTVLEPR